MDLVGKWYRAAKPLARISIHNFYPEIISWRVERVGTWKRSERVSIVCFSLVSHVHFSSFWRNFWNLFDFGLLGSTLACFLDYFWLQSGPCLILDRCWLNFGTILGPVWAPKWLIFNTIFIEISVFISEAILATFWAPFWYHVRNILGEIELFWMSKSSSTSAVGLDFQGCGNFVARKGRPKRESFSEAVFRRFLTTISGSFGAQK